VSAISTIIKIRKYIHARPTAARKFALRAIVFQETLNNNEGYYNKYDKNSGWNIPFHLFYNKMIKFAVPSSRVHEWSDALAGGTNMPAQPRIVGAESAILVGGSTIVADVNKYYVAVGASGMPLNLKTRKNIFQASAPSVAATKFFNSWWKSTSQGPCSTSSASYEEAFANISRTQLSKELLVRVAEVGGKSVRTYIVKYVPNTKPNALEIKNKIVCTSKATLLDSKSPRPASVIELEAYAGI
jgi:hypothetical protein